MKDVSDEWVYVNSSQRVAMYTNLDPGSYTFHVIGSNNDGVWNMEGTTLNIKIIPPSPELLKN
ncbi:MAG: hypothetical protein L3J69_14245 [Desulfobacula sp.]|nr:hypothetical protein [Desulfobacula sp.]